MSIVAVHGPHTWGSGAVQGTGPMIGVVDPTNGLKWDFKLAGPTTRPDADIKWEFLPDGTPATVMSMPDPPPITFTAAGEKTVKLTITNSQETISNKELTGGVAILTTADSHFYKVGQSIVIAGVGAPFNGTFTITAIAGLTFSYAVPGAADVASAAATGTATSDPNQYPPAGVTIDVYTVAAGTAPLLAEEQTTNGNGVYYPSDHTVDEVKAEADKNLDDLPYIESLLEAEKAGKNRSTLVSYLEGLLTT